MRRACIDIGSNTTRLLVADCAVGSLLELHQERAFTALGQSLDGEGAIPEAKLHEVAGVVAAQLANAARFEVSDVRCVATAGVRRATNRTCLINMISERCAGLQVEILSGEEEARLAFIGAAWGLQLADDEPAPIGALGVVDVGGGSCELAVGVPPDRVNWWWSLPVGSGDLVRAHLISDPPSVAQIAHAAEHVRLAFADVRPPPAAKVVAVGGSATSLTQIAGRRLDADALQRTLELLSTWPSAILAQRLGLDVRRVRLLPAGLLILERIAELFTAPLLIGTGGIREGLLLAGSSTSG